MLGNNQAPSRVSPGENRLRNVRFLRRNVEPIAKRALDSGAGAAAEEGTQLGEMVL